MFYHDSKLQYEVKVDKPDPMFAKMLQQAIGGIEGEYAYACSTSSRHGATGGL
jgi:Mn-containing catalase